MDFTSINLKYLYNAAEYREKVYSKGPYISTGSKELDTLLDYGIEPLKMYNFYGPAGSGKTFLLHQIVANSFLEYAHYNYHAVYLDGEGNFSIDLLLKLLRANCLPIEAAKSILYSRINTHVELLLLLNKLLKMKKRISVIVVDNFPDVISRNLARPKMLHGYLKHLMIKLHSLKEELEVPVVITSRVYSILHELFPDSYEHYGGIALKSMVNSVIGLSKEGTFFRAIDGFGSKGSALFRITNEGIRDL
ncbi:MAG: hypothetical protein QXH96_01075 [Candidatus Geothermarchaeota archaeon]